MSALVLVAHGSRDPRAATTVRALARAVACARPCFDVRTAYLELTAPSPKSVLGSIAASGHRTVVVVPLLLTDGFHHRIDLPAVFAEPVVARGRLALHRARVLGPSSGEALEYDLLAALRRRIDEGGGDFDALVLGAAGTSDPLARSAIAATARALGRRLGVECSPGYAAGEPNAAAAVSAFAARGVRRVLVASYFLAPGVLHDRLVESVVQAGAVGVSAPLGDAPELVQLVLARADRALGQPSPPRGAGRPL